MLKASKFIYGEQPKKPSITNLWHVEGKTVEFEVFWFVRKLYKWF